MLATAVACAGAPQQRILFVMHGLAFGGRGCYVFKIHDSRLHAEYNMTLGFPGEGPESQGGALQSVATMTIKQVRQILRFVPTLENIT